METETLTDITENRDAAMTAVNTENPETASEPGRNNRAS